MSLDGYRLKEEQVQLTCRIANTRHAREIRGVGALQILQKLAKDGQIAMSKEKRNDCLSEKVGHRAIVHSTKRANTIVQLPSAPTPTDTYHALKIPFTRPDKVTL